MLELAFLLAMTITIMIVTVIHMKKKILNSFWADFSTHVILLFVGWIIFSILSGLFIVFDDLEHARDYSNQELLHGLKVGMRLTAWGLLILYMILFSRSKIKSTNQD
jgi:hypothetical protein